MKYLHRRLMRTVLAVFLLFSQLASADSLRCGMNLIDIGDTKADVERKCGPPVATDSYCRNEYLQGRFGVEEICHRVNLWTLNLGTGKFLQNVEFEEGRVTNITHGARLD